MGGERKKRAGRRAQQEEEQVAVILTALMGKAVVCSVTCTKLSLVESELLIHCPGKVRPLSVVILAALLHIDTLWAHLGCTAGVLCCMPCVLFSMLIHWG